MQMWQTIRPGPADRHIHAEAYASIVLSGGYEEAGDYGRLRVTTGGVIFHERFEAHLDRVDAGGAVVLNLPLQRSAAWQPGMAMVNDVDQIVRVAERNSGDAINLVLSTTTPVEMRYPDWPDILAANLASRPNLHLCEWAEENDLGAWKVSRDFKRVFGTTPEAFRARARARKAWTRIDKTDDPLAKIAADLHFTDQPHMTRSVKAFTGISPRGWRGLLKT